MGQRRARQEVWWQLDGTDFRLLEELAYLQRDKGFSFPSREYLGSRLKLSIWTVSRHTRKLKGLGILAIEQRRYRRGNGTWCTRSNVYKVLTFIGSKVRSILSLLTGVRRSARRPKQKEKEDRFDLSFIKNQAVKSQLQRFSTLGTARNQP